MDKQSSILWGVFLGFFCFFGVFLCFFDSSLVYILFVYINTFVEHYIPGVNDLDIVNANNATPIWRILKTGPELPCLNLQLAKKYLHKSQNQTHGKIILDQLKGHMMLHMTPRKLSSEIGRTFEQSLLLHLILKKNLHLYKYQLLNSTRIANNKKKVTFGKHSITYYF